jgi:hypothetical protein
MFAVFGSQRPVILGPASLEDFLSVVQNVGNASFSTGRRDLRRDREVCVDDGQLRVFIDISTGTLVY